MADVDDVLNVEESSNWRFYEGEEPLGAFLYINRPSMLSITDTPWIYVENENEQQESEEYDSEDDQKQEDDEQDDQVQDSEEQEEKKRDEAQKDNKLDDKEHKYEKLENQDQVDDKQDDKAKQKDQAQKDEILKEESAEDIPFYLIRIAREWKSLLRTTHDVKMVAHEKLKELAVKYNYTCGKWMVFGSSNNIDEKWFTIAKAVVAGKLGQAAKVSTKNPTENNHVICVYTEDFTDESEVRRVEKGLRDLGITQWMSYKADIYTILGIYMNNNLGISPTIFKSEAVHVTHGSDGEDYQWQKKTGNRKDYRVKQFDWANDGKESLDSFLERNKPSHVNNRDVPWICVRYKHGHNHEDLSSKYNGDDMALIKTEWQEQLKKRAIKMFAAEVLKDLAVKHNYTSGKWMIFANREEIDGLWFTVAKAVAAGRLGNEAKVSTNENHVIYVYTQDFTDEGDVRRVEKGLRDSGIRTMMSYKPDIYTALGISAKNELGIPPTVYKSKAYKHWSGYSSRF